MYPCMNIILNSELCLCMLSELSRIEELRSWGSYRSFFLQPEHNEKQVTLLTYSSETWDLS